MRLLQPRIQFRPGSGLRARRLGVINRGRAPLVVPVCVLRWSPGPFKRRWIVRRRHEDQALSWLVKPLEQAVGTVKRLWSGSVCVDQCGG